MYTPALSSASNLAIGDNWIGLVQQLGMVGAGGERVSEGIRIMFQPRRSLRSWRLLPYQEFW